MLKANKPNSMKAPPEPALVRLTPTCVEMLVERYARFLVETEKGFTTALSPSHL